MLNSHRLAGHWHRSGQGEDLHSIARVGAWITAFASVGSNAVRLAKRVPTVKYMMQWFELSR